jgi:hypothetical protein
MGNSTEAWVASFDLLRPSVIVTQEGQPTEVAFTVAPATQQG